MWEKNDNTCTECDTRKKDTDKNKTFFLDQSAVCTSVDLVNMHSTKKTDGKDDDKPGNSQLGVDFFVK